MDRRTLLDRIEAIPVTGDPACMRRDFERLADLPPVPFDGIERVRLIGGVETVCLTPTRVRRDLRDARLIYLHGGGYVFGSPDSHANLARVLAAQVGCELLMPRYPLAPERRWPAQRDAVMALLDALNDASVTGTRPKRIALVGDSAGGHLALCAAIKCTAMMRTAIAAAPGAAAAAAAAGAGHALSPSAVAVFSPNTLRDYSLSETREAQASRDAMNDPEQDHALAALTFDDVRPSEPEQSLIHADLSSLPPIYIDVGEHEILLDDSLQFARAAARQGVELSLHVRPGAFHLQQLFAGHFAPADASLAGCARWLGRRLSNGQTASTAAERETLSA